MNSEMIVIAAVLGVGAVMAWVGWLARLSLKLVLGVIVIWLVLTTLGYGFIRSQGTLSKAPLPARAVICLVEDLTHGEAGRVVWWAADHPAGLRIGLEWRPKCPRSKLTIIDRK